MPRSPTAEPGGLPPGRGRPVGSRDARGRDNGRAAPAGGGGFAAGRQGPQRRAAPVPGVAPEATAPSAVSPSTRAVSRRERGRGPVVAVTGAAHGLGHALTVRLAASARIGRVVAIDGHRGDATGVTWRVVDVRDPALAGRLAGVDVVVHTDLDLAPDSDHRSRRAFNV